jgi:epoxyqueuosine reductase
LLHIEKHTQLIKQFSKQLGFDACGIAKAVVLTDDAKRLEQWLHKGFNGKMHYMENYFEQRINPSVLVPGAKSVITLIKNYFPSQQQKTSSPKISKYAFGNDYHQVIKNKLKEFLFLLNENIGEINGRGFVDSAPVLERAWATKSGLGWIGKNGNLITKHNGSFFFIATLIIDVELKYDTAFVNDFCGSCMRCINSCPTQAILPDKIIDGSKCISYFTIELKDLLLPQEMKNKFDNWIFGCDVCQDVCPWNRFSKPHHEPEFTPVQEILNFSIHEWQQINEENFNHLFKYSPLKRAKWSGIQRNLKFIQQGR